MTEHRNKKASTFLLKTYKILENSDYEDIVRWNEEQTGFFIIDENRFASTVLPHFFKHNKMHSYIRQLNMYGFSKKRAKNENYYHHPLFLKNKPELISEIQRKEEKKISKHPRESTVSIQSRLPYQDQTEQLSRLNYCLLMEQTVNLKLILAELQEPTQKEKFERVSSEYLSRQWATLEKFKENKQDQSKTADTLMERGEKMNII